MEEYMNMKMKTEGVCEKTSVIIGKVKIGRATIIFIFGFGIIFSRVENSEAIVLSSVPLQAPIMHFSKQDPCKKIRIAPMIQERFDKVKLIPSK